MNSINTSRGGTHVTYIADQVSLYKGMVEEKCDWGGLSGDTASVTTENAGFLWGAFRALICQGTSSNELYELHLAHLLNCLWVLCGAVHFSKCADGHSSSHEPD